jgi:hypothetical protein
LSLLNVPYSGALATFRLWDLRILCFLHTSFVGLLNVGLIIKKITKRDRIKLKT